MSLLPGFADELPAQAARLAPSLRAMAREGLYFGGSSWKYEGWLGSIYSPALYETRGKLSKKKFEENCLAEYARVFPCVCGDFAFYQFPSDQYWSKLFGDTPVDFLFGLKVPEDVTVPHWPKHARYGAKAGRPNEHFLSAELFTKLFADRLKPYRGRVATLIFEFGTMARSVFKDAGDFLERLDPFLADLPGGFRYAIEIRNPEYLREDYFSVLKSRNVAHVFNAWTRMPELSRQMELDGAFTADFAVVRALLAKGRNYDGAVESFEPYDKTREVNEAARTAMADLARRCRARKAPAFIFVNNRLEGNSPSTIEAVVDLISSAG